MTITAPLVFIDTETDGLDPKRRAWEVAMIRREPDGSQQETAFFIAADSPGRRGGDPMALAIGGYHSRHPVGRYQSGLDSDAPRAWYGNTSAIAGTTGGYLTASDAAANVARWTHGTHLVGAVPSFDAETLARLLRRWDIAPGWHYHVIDVEVMALGWLAGRGQALTVPYSGQALGAALGVIPQTPDERHTALGDARWAMRMWDAMTAEAQR